MAIQVEDFEVQVAGAPELAMGVGVGRLLAAMLGRAGVAAVRLSGRIELDGEWRAAWRAAEQPGEAQAAWADGHHLLYRIVEHTVRAAGAEAPAWLPAAFLDLETAAPAAMLAIWSAWAAEAGARRAAWVRAFELDPSCVAARVSLARLALETDGGAAPAAAALLRGVAVQDAEAARELGLELWSGNEPEAAAGLLQTAVRLRPDDAVVAAALAALLARGATGGDTNEALEEALLLASRATQLAPDDFRGWAALADVHRAKGEYGQAGFYYASALRLEPAAAAVLKDAAACWLLAGEPRRALPLVERAIAAAPGDAENLGNLAFVRHLLQEPEAALEAARRAVALAPDHARLGVLHGDCALRAGRREEAAQAWARAAALEPGMTINPNGGNVVA